ncbi:signal recognition particle 14 kDa protein-like [Diospyros lotus]|uniref:signal recognition particle 14 kDa protein-like n=1 Tax=Diospyros lotus TaxID=55363 RepID=UPI0022592D49|nr:signal recognition particle 14 kDa protein-like [Diospyros lotus]
MVLLQTDLFLTELTTMFEHAIEKGSIWVTFKRSSMKSKAQRKKKASKNEQLEYKCLIRATNGKKTISTWVGPNEHQCFQASYAAILKAQMTVFFPEEEPEWVADLLGEDEPEEVVGDPSPGPHPEESHP